LAVRGTSFVFENTDENEVNIHMLTGSGDVNGQRLNAGESMTVHGTGRSGRKSQTKNDLQVNENLSLFALNEINNKIVELIDNGILSEGDKETVSTLIVQKESEGQTQNTHTANVPPQSRPLQPPPSGGSSGGGRPQPTPTPTPEPEPTPEPITSVEIIVAAPQPGAIPNRIAIGGTSSFSVSNVTWLSATTGGPTSNMFLGSTRYVAVVTLTVADENKHTFTGITEGQNLTINGIEATIVNNTGNELVISRWFETPSATLTSLSIPTWSPLNFVVGQYMELYGQLVRFHFNDGTYQDFPFRDVAADFIIVTNPPIGTPLSLADNGARVFITHIASTATAVLGTLVVNETPVAPMIMDFLPSGVVNTPYLQGLSLAGTVPITWTLSGTLPTGLSFDDETGVIYGTPTVAGTFTFSVTATNAAGGITRMFDMEITDNNSNIITLTTIQGLRPVYNAEPIRTIENNQWTASISWRNSAGVPLPAGATFSAGTTYVADIFIIPHAGWEIGTAAFAVANASVSQVENIVTATFVSTAEAASNPNIQLSAPVAGGTPMWLAPALWLEYGGDDLNVTWYENNVPLPADAEFSAGGLYTARVTLTIPSNFVFTDDFSATMGGIDATIISRTDTSVTLEVTFFPQPVIAGITLADPDILTDVTYSGTTIDAVFDVSGSNLLGAGVGFSAEIPVPWVVPDPIAYDAANSTLTVTLTFAANPETTWRGTTLSISHDFVTPNITAEFPITQLGENIFSARATLQAAIDDAEDLLDNIVVSTDGAATGVHPDNPKPWVADESVLTDLNEMISYAKNILDVATSTVADIDAAKAALYFEMEVLEDLLNPTGTGMATMYINGDTDIATSNFERAITLSRADAAAIHSITVTGLVTVADSVSLKSDSPSLPSIKLIIESGGEFTTTHTIDLYDTEIKANGKFIVDNTSDVAAIQADGIEITNDGEFLILRLCSLSLYGSTFTNNGIFEYNSPGHFCRIGDSEIINTGTMRLVEGNLVGTPNKFVLRDDGLLFISSTLIWDYTPHSEMIITSGDTTGRIEIDGNVSVQLIDRANFHQDEWIETPFSGIREGIYHWDDDIGTGSPVWRNTD
jgi:hypothetical protein